MRIFLCLLLLCPLFAEEELVVHLNSQKTLTPLHLTSIQNKGDFEQSYIDLLQQVWNFDFANDGSVQLVSKPENVITLRSVLTKKSLSITLTNPKTGTVHGIEDITLSGNLSKDRKILHRLHDTVFETLFHTPGIADTRILYTVRTKKTDSSSNWETTIWESDYDGANAKLLISNGHLCVTPTFIPALDKKRAEHFLYVSYQVGQPKIYVSSLETGIGTRLSFLKGNQLMPQISPTLDKIAFISDVTGNPDLFVQDFSLEQGLLGKPRQIFYAASAAQGTPTFSPDGKKIAFVSNKDGTPRIYILDIPKPGTPLQQLQPTMISKKTRNNTCPNWSPDGKKIAYSATTAGVRQIWIYDLLTSEEQQLTEGSGHKENPVWAPNSTHLLFDSATDLFMINLNQKKGIKITSGPGEKRFPSWEPLKQKRSI
ncbi:MAG: Tol-Pal system protein TolB [Chlamydiales bacterium]|nr:Tol-Pal system protein TolB [Chlamydiales bacterium]